MKKCYSFYNPTGVEYLKVLLLLLKNVFNYYKITTFISDKYLLTGEFFCIYYSLINIKIIIHFIKNLQ